MQKIILGIETSCDETGVALYGSEDGLIDHKLYSQITTHAPFGGVVPELASRDHIKKISILTNELLQSTSDFCTKIDAIAYTAGPGLIGALLVGATFAASLSYAWQIPTIPIHHMEAHLLAPMLEKNPPQFPFIALLVSGGHTMLVRVSDFGDYKILGESLDDAAGEAFDKIAKVLGLGYPGGAALAKLAENGDGNRFYFPRPMLEHPGLDFSFSGLKTFALNTLRKYGGDEQTKADIARAFQDAAVETLVKKCKRALKQTKLTRLLVAGGVSANKYLRETLNDFALTEGIEVFFPRLEFCTDNAAMVAYTGCQKILHGYEGEYLNIKVFPRWPI